MVPDDSDVYTVGNFETEADAEKAFDDLFEVHASGLFILYKQVWCKYDETSRDSLNKRGRIDRVAVPTQKAIDAGWRSGVFGIECKASQRHLGKLMLQCIDYRLAKFFIPGEQTPIPLSTIVMWPTQTMKYTSASICDNWRLATMEPYRYKPENERISIKLGGQTWLAMQNGELLDRVASTDSKGFKVGNRS